MTALTFRVIPSVEIVASQFQTTHMRIVHAFDTFSKAGMHDAVPQWQLRRAQRELDHHRRLIRTKNKSSVKTAKGAQDSEAVVADGQARPWCPRSTRWLRSLMPANVYSVER